MYTSGNSSSVNITNSTSEYGCCYGTQDDIEPLYEVAFWTLPEQVGIITGFALLVILIAVGNLTIILAVCKDPVLHSSLANLFYVSLAVADLLVGVTVVPFMGLFVYLGYWPLGYLLCDLWLSIDFLCCTASFYTLTAISWDRYRAVCNPFDHLSTKSRRRVVCMLIGVWTAAILVWVPAIFVVRKLSALYEDYYCLFATSPEYVIVSCIIAYYIPIILMLSLYGVIYMTIRRALKNPVKITGDRTSGFPESPYSFNEKQTTKPETAEVSVSVVSLSVSTSDFSSETTNGVGSKGSNKKIHSGKLSDEYRTEKQRRAAVTLGVIMAAFLICWCPWVVIWPLESYWPSSIPLWLYNLAAMMAYINSLLNPFLYVFSNPSFRAGVRRLLFHKNTAK